MSALDAIKKQVYDYMFGSEQAVACVQIIDVLERTACEELRMLTYQSLSKATERSIEDPALVLAINLLVNSDRFRLLEKHYLVLDSGHGLTQEISDEEVADAYRSGSLLLPNGDEVDNVADYLLPYFTASKRLKELKGRECQAS